MAETSAKDHYRIYQCPRCLRRGVVMVTPGAEPNATIAAEALTSAGCRCGKYSSPRYADFDPADETTLDKLSLRELVALDKRLQKGIQTQ